MAWSAKSSMMRYRAVSLLTDKDSGSAAFSRFPHSAPSRGTGEPLLVLKYVPNDDNVNNGERG